MNCFYPFLTFLIMRTLIVHGRIIIELIVAITRQNQNQNSSRLFNRNTCVKLPFSVYDITDHNRLPTDLNNISPSNTCHTVSNCYPEEIAHTARGNRFFRKKFEMEVRCIKNHIKYICFLKAIYPSKTT